MKTAANETLHRLYGAIGAAGYDLCIFGNTLAEREGYTHLEGMEAVYAYLVNKHHWLPRDVRSMSVEDLQLALLVEMQGWTVPSDAR